MNMEDIIVQLMYTTAPIYVVTPENKIVTGTGFLFSVTQSENSSILLYITDYGVVKDAISGYIELHMARSGKPTREVVRAEFDKSILKECKLGNLDLVALPIGTAIVELQNKNITVFYKSIDINLFPKEDEIEDLGPIEDIIFIGYPNFLYDKVNRIPVVKHGITATPIINNYLGKEEFLIDEGTLPGFNGSPVFVYNRGIYPTKDGMTLGSRLMIVGILSQELQNKNMMTGTGLSVVTNYRALYRELNNYMLSKIGTSIEKK